MDGRQAHNADATVGTAVDVGVWRRDRDRRGLGRRCGRRGRRQHDAAAVEEGAAATIREQAEVADAHEAGRHDVQEKPTQKLFGGERHHLLAAAVGVVFPPEAHPTSLQVHELLCA